MRTCVTVTNKHRIILPVVIIDLVLLQRSRQDLPRGIVQADFEGFEPIFEAIAFEAVSSLRAARLDGLAVDGVEAWDCDRDCGCEG